MVQKINYYPFGKVHTKVADTINRYLYNGKEMQDSSSFYDYGARYYNPDIGRFLTIDKYAEKYYMLTPYQYAANNPIKYIDVNGDSIGPTNNLTKDQMNAMTQFAATKEGNKFLSNYAKAGQQVFGQTFNKSGKYDKKGINLNYSNLGEPNRSSTGGFISSNKNLEIYIRLSTDGAIDISNNKTFNIIGDIAHESFIHANLFSNDYLDDGQQNYSNISEWTKNNINGYYWHYHHTEFSKNYYSNTENEETFKNIYGVLYQINSQMNLNVNNRNIKEKIWKFDGSNIGFDLNGKIIWK